MKVCEVCGGPEHPAWKAHVFASNAASNKESDASNEIRRIDARFKQSGGQVGEAPRSKRAVAGVARNAGGEDHQRWSREAYNRYQRVLMALRRTGAAIKAGRACPWRS